MTSSLLGYWDGGYNASVEIENISDATLQNWYIQFESEAGITNIWNAEIVSVENSRYIVKNAGWNSDIPVGGSIQFGMSFNMNFKGFPTAYEVIGNRNIAEGENLDSHLNKNGILNLHTLHLSMSVRYTWILS